MFWWSLQVANNPFQNWGHLSVKTPAKALRDNFFSTVTETAPSEKSPAGKVAQLPTPPVQTSKRGRKRKEPC